jgi:16S rRNA (guanine527-N7)-methyltransferase
MNLTAIREPSEVARLHVIDSLSALAPMRARGIDKFVDLGSGAGFPGFPLAISLPARRALLVDSIGKKTGFLETVIAAVGADGVEVATARSEDLAVPSRERGRWPAVLARAVGGLADLVELAFPLLGRGGWLVAWKRGDIDTEMDQARRAVDALGGGAIETIGAAPDYLPGHVLVFVRKEGPTAVGWPRDPAARRRRPW